MNTFEINDIVKIHSLPEVEDAPYNYNGHTATVVALPGYNKGFPKCYGIRMESGEDKGKVLPAIPRHLMIADELPSRRWDTDLKLTWEQFDKATGIDSMTFRGLRDFE